VIFVKDLLFAVLALVSAVIAVVTFLNYQKSANTMMIIVAIICIIATLGFGAVFLSGRVNKHEDIHITE
jgi:fumarate reductase subunit C